MCKVHLWQAEETHCALDCLVNLQQTLQSHGGADLTVGGGASDVPSSLSVFPLSHSCAPVVAAEHLFLLLKYDAASP